MSKIHTSENMHLQYEPDALPDIVKLKIKIGYGVGKYNQGQIDISYFTSRSNDFAAVELAETEIEVAIPRGTVNVRDKLLEILKDEREEVLAQNHMRLREIDEKISKALAIEYHGAA